MSEIVPSIIQIKPYLTQGIVLSEALSTSYRKERTIDENTRERTHKIRKEKTRYKFVLCTRSQLVNVTRQIN